MNTPAGPKRHDPLAYVRPNILSLSPYSTARDDFHGGDISVWLDANENPHNHGTSDGSFEVEINRYPDPHQRALKEAVARLKGVAPENIFIGGAGSDEAIDLIYRIFCTPGKDNVIAISPSYGVYKVAAEINDIEYREVRLNSDFSLPSDKLLAAADSRTKVLWICSPNNPTANAFPLGEISLLADRFDGIVAVDEAYIEFSAKGSMLPLLADHPNLIVLQTFSKAWAMASLRLGMAFAAPEVARLFAMVKYPYNVNGLTQREVIKQITREIDAEVREIIQSRERLADAMNKIAAVKYVYPSDANFLLVKVDDAKRMYDYLVSCGILVRDRSRQPLCDNCLRFTIGTPEETDKTIIALKRYPL